MTYQSMKREAAIAEFGPVYKVHSVSIAKFRQKAKDGLSKLTAKETEAYGLAVLKAVGSQNRVALNRALEPTTRCPCASGSWASDAIDIFAAIRKSNLAAFNAPPSQWKEPDEEVSAYVEAIAYKAVSRELGL